ncbi:hypothetical protein Bca101_065824 [Brassica carinata]
MRDIQFTKGTKSSPPVAALISEAPSQCPLSGGTFGAPLAMDYLRVLLSLRSPSLAQTRSYPYTLLAKSSTHDAVVCNVEAAWDKSTMNCGVGCVFSGWSHLPRLDQISVSCGSVSSALMAHRR